MLMQNSARLWLSWHASRATDYFAANHMGIDMGKYNTHKHKDWTVPWRYTVEISRDTACRVWAIVSCLGGMIIENLSHYWSSGTLNPRAQAFWASELDKDVSSCTSFETDRLCSIKLNITVAPCTSASHWHRIVSCELLNGRVAIIWIWLIFCHNRNEEPCHLSATDSNARKIPWHNRLDMFKLAIKFIQHHIAYQGFDSIVA
jgi:hypothetical protein